MFVDKALVFDVDGTLYPKSAGLENDSDRLCVEFLVKNLGFASQDAIVELERLRANGEYESSRIEKIYGVPQNVYMDYICNMDTSPLHPNPKLDKLLSTLPHSKFVLTDATIKHCADVLQALKVNPQHFKLIFDAEAGNFEFKYHRKCYELFFAKAGITGTDMIFFEDNLSNLRFAKELGAVTVWISETLQTPPDYVDYSFVDINQALEFIKLKICE